MDAGVVPYSRDSGRSVYQNHSQVLRDCNTPKAVNKHYHGLVQRVLRNLEMTSSPQQTQLKTRLLLCY